MVLRILENPDAVADAAAASAATILRETIRERGRARLTAATGLSQLEFLARLVAAPDIPWSSVELFHLDEYLGLSPNHPASFQRYLRERLVLPTGITHSHLLDGLAHAQQTCALAGEAITASPVDLTIVGIGENGHLAFNDPPADFTNDEPFFVVALDERCRRQQVKEGWFATIDDVPRQAITMSIQQILRSRAILCIAPEARKAEAVRNCFTGDIGPMFPGSALRLHPDATVLLDRASADLLEGHC